MLNVISFLGVLLPVTDSQTRGGHWKKRKKNEKASSWSWVPFPFALKQKESTKRKNRISNSKAFDLVHFPFLSVQRVVISFGFAIFSPASASDRLWEKEKITKRYRRRAKGHIFLSLYAHIPAQAPTAGAGVRKETRKENNPMSLEPSSGAHEDKDIEFTSRAQMLELSMSLRVRTRFLGLFSFIYTSNHRTWKRPKESWDQPLAFSFPCPSMWRIEK